MYQKLKQFFLKHGFERNYFIAYSGGLDSSVLLHLLNTLQKEHPIKLHAVHIHHGLNKNADAWMLHCQNYCNEIAVPFSHFKVNAKAQLGESPENIARIARYNILTDLLNENDFLLTAHHQDDQAETLLLQLFRGSGLKGLAAMPHVKSLGKGVHARPLLNFSRRELQQYAEKNKLQWLNDDSNNNVNFTRNFIRHEVMSLLKSRWPNISDTLSRTAYHCNESQEIIDEFTKNDLMQCKTANNTLSIIKLISFDEKTQRQIIRLWLLEKNIVLPSEKKMQQILTTVLKAREDKTPLLKWGNFEIRRYRDELYVMSALEEFDADKKYAWDFQAPLQIPGIGTLSVNTVKGAGLKKEIQSVMVCFRQPGCKILLSGTHHSYLKNLFQEWGIPPWERGRIPLLFVDNQCVGVLLSDKWVLAEHVRARGDEEGWFVVSQV